MTRVVGIGDSIAAGVGDSVPLGASGGWSGRLSHRLDAERHVNLGKPGALIGDLEARVPAAVTFAPDLILLSVGGNDVVRAGFDAARFGVRLRTCLRRLAAGGAVIVVLTVPDVSRSCPMPHRIRTSLHHRLHAVNAELRAAAAEVGAVLLDRWQDPAAYDPALLHADRVHPAPAGYEVLVEETVRLLGIECSAPALPTDADMPARGFWLVTSGLSWVLRRGTIVLPGMVEVALQCPGQATACSGCSPADATGRRGMARQASPAMIASVPASTQATR